MALEECSFFLSFLNLNCSIPFVFQDVCSTIYVPGNRFFLRYACSIHYTSIWTVLHRKPLYCIHYLVYEFDIFIQYHGLSVYYSVLYYIWCCGFLCKPSNDIKINVIYLYWVREQVKNTGHFEMAMLFWCLSKSVFSTVYEFFKAIFHVGICWFPKHICS